jgi:hypothetical protein
MKKEEYDKMKLEFIGTILEDAMLIKSDIKNGKIIKTLNSNLSSSVDKFIETIKKEFVKDIFKRGEFIHKEVLRDECFGVDQINELIKSKIEVVLENQSLEERVIEILKRDCYRNQSTLYFVHWDNEYECPLGHELDLINGTLG